MKQPPRLLRVSLTQELSQQIDALFRAQAAAFVPNDVELVAFDGRYEPDDDELFRIDNFPDSYGVLPTTGNALGVPVLQLTDQNVGLIGALAYVYTENGVPRAAFQPFDTRRAITNSGVTLWQRFHDNATMQRWEGVALTLDSHVSAILFPDHLLFRSLRAARRLFDMSAYYAEATDDDLATFCGHGRLCVQDGFDLAEIADSWIRGRVGLITKSGVLDSVAPRRLRTIASRFRLGLQLRRVNGEERIELPTTRKEMKRLLKFLDEDYYQSPLTSSQFVSNSKKPLQ